MGGSCERAAKGSCAREGVWEGNSGTAVSDNSFSEAWKHMQIVKVMVACKHKGTVTCSHISRQTDRHGQRGREMSGARAEKLKCDG